MLLILFLSCTGPDEETLALKACEMMPGLNVDAVGMTLSDGLFEASERTLWAERVPSVGLETVGVAGLGVIRANSSCVVQSRAGDAFTMTRTEPDVDPTTLEDNRDIKKLEMIDRSFTLRVVQTADGPRAALPEGGVAAIRGAVADAQKRRDAGDYDGALAALKAQYAAYPDPMLIWEIAEVEARAGAASSFSWELLDGERLSFRHDGPQAVDLSLVARAGGVSGTLAQADMLPDLEIVLPLPDALLEAVEAEEAIEVAIERVSAFP